jgi:ribosomal protein S18 acetylase RimI-like enzyme
MMVIRDMQKQDLAQLAALYEQFWGEKSDAEAMARQLDRLSTRDSHILLAAEGDGRLLGSVMGVICEELYGDCRPFLVLENMIVDRNLRRAGIGRALMAELERRAKARGCTQVILVTEKDRQDACAFYESAGFAPDKNAGYKKKL